MALKLVYNVFTGTFDWVDGSGGGGSPGGSNTQIQYNNNGVFGGVDVLTYDNLTEIVTSLNTFILENYSGITFQNMGTIYAQIAPVAGEPNKIDIVGDGSGPELIFDFSGLTAVRTATFQDKDGTVAYLSDIGGTGSIIAATNTGDDQTYTLAQAPTSMNYYAIINNGSYTTDDALFPFSVTGTTLTFTSPLPNDLANTIIKLICV